MSGQATVGTDTIELAAGDYQASIDRRGAALQRLVWRDRDLVWGYPPGEAPVAFQGQVLLPWPNRIGDGRYSFAGVEHRLEITEPGRATALHGLTHSAAWLPADISSTDALLTHVLDGAPGYPFRLELSVRYDLDPVTGLSVCIGARNAGADPAPYGNGTHNYLTVGSVVDEAVLALPAGAHLPVDERLLPCGPPTPVRGTPLDFTSAHRIGETVFDTAFTDLRRGLDGLAWTVLSDRDHAVALWADASYRWLQVFSSDVLEPGVRRRQLAVEPMTCPPNGFASGTDLIVLAPGETTESRYGIRRVDPVPAHGDRA
ncbi:aldose 1-epimerase family protein [Marinactinospora thermotolerans]|uniref:aldose 1-epimerase family protein n=1 Tax=Marinactinospora thermotolerans TaxID=531310 RepID=UPI003D94294A